MRYGVTVPNIGDLDTLVSLGVEAERAGWDGFFCGTTWRSRRGRGARARPVGRARGRDVADDTDPHRHHGETPSPVGDRGSSPGRL